MIELNENKILKALSKIHDGLNRYSWIQNNCQICNVAESEDFQLKFNAFYRVRRNALWRKTYYECFEMAKARPMTFQEVLQELNKKTGRLEASFASKMVATIQPTKPVIDKFVLQNFGLRLPYYNSSNRIAKIGQVYEELCQKYKVLLASNEGQYICEQFSERYPLADITDLKKIDLVLWQIR